MDKKIIYIEIDEEITSIVDKIKESKAANVILVVPKRARILQSLVSLKLLKKQAEKYGKNVILVTLDRIGRHLASQAGFEVYQKITKGGKIVFPVEEVVKKPEKNFEDKLPEVANKKDFQEKNFEKNNEREENKISFSGISEIKNIFKNKKIISEKDDEIIKKKESEKESVLKEKTDQKNNIDISSYLTVWPVSKKILIGFLILGFFVFLYIFSIILPHAKVDIYLKANQVSKTLEVVLSPSAQEIDYNKNLIPAREVIADIEVNGEFPTITEKEIKTKAVGILKIKNTDITGFSWPARGLITFSPANNLDLNFVTSTPVYELKPGQEIQINIEAEDFGEKYNLPAGTVFKAKALIGKAYESSIIITAPSGTWGGSNKKVKILSGEDINKAKEKFIAENKEIILNRIKSQVKPKEILDERFVFIDLKDYTTNPEINKETEKFTLSGKLSAKAFLFTEEDFKKLILEKIKTEISSDNNILEEEIIWNFSEISLSNQMVKLKIETLGWVVPQIHKEDLKKKITSLNPEEARKEIMKINDVKKVDINITPSFRKTLPSLSSHIEIRIKPEK